MVARKRHLLDPTVNARLFECFKRRRLRLRQSWFDAALGKNPTSAARPHQEKFDSTRACAIANGGNLLAQGRARGLGGRLYSS